MSRCTLLAGDIDFQPLIEALVREGMFVDILHPPRASAALLDSADNAALLTVAYLGSALHRRDGRALLPQQVTDIRPHKPADIRHVWGNGHFVYELRWVHEGYWLLERYERAAAALSLQMRDTELRILIEAARDVAGIEPDSSVLELVASVAQA
jgi:hypothetical protein